MKHPTKTDRLLDEMLAENAPADFDESLMRQMVRVARQRRRVRRFGKALLVVAGVVALSLWLRPSQTREPVQTVKPAPAPAHREPFDLVTTQPLPPGMMVNTQTGLVRIITTSQPAVTFVATRSADELFQELNDDQLLAMLQDKPVALVRYGPHEAALVMPEELLQEGFRVQ